MIDFLLVMIFGALGALSRFWLNGWMSRKWETAFPLGTLIVNISGSFAAGLCAGLLLHIPGSETVLLPVLIGYLGAYTTFSTWMVQTFGLIEAGRWWYLIANTIGAVLIGVLAALAGLWLASFV